MLKSLKNTLQELAIPPRDKAGFEEWIGEPTTIEFLESNAHDDEMVIFVSLPNFFLHVITLPNAEVGRLPEMSEWNGNAYSSWSLFLKDGDVGVEAPLANIQNGILEKGEQIVFRRRFDGVPSKLDYFEVSQQLVHVLGLHYLPEREAWCRLDERGDIDSVIKIHHLTLTNEYGNGVYLTMTRKDIERYCLFTKFHLVRMFDATKFDIRNFSGWQGKLPERKTKQDLVYSVTLFPGYGSIIRGVQQIQFVGDAAKALQEWWSPQRLDSEYENFIIHDWKSQQIVEWSCHPSAFSSYFVKSDLPYETSPVFFNAEVLVKYKTDRDKYKFDDRTITSRAGWSLDYVDANDAGQIHAYLYELSRLPYAEQMHWKQYNEPMKALISERALAQDFEGNWKRRPDPLKDLKRKLQALHSTGAEWWTLRNINLIEQVQYPFSQSTNEWSEEIMNLDKLLIEGLEERWLKRRLKALGVDPQPTWRSLKLLEEVLINLGFESEHAASILTPFHDVHNLRSKLKGHANGQEGQRIKDNAIAEFTTFKQHFAALCERCDESLEVFLEVLADQSPATPHNV